MNFRQRILAAIDGQEIYPVCTDVMENLIYPTLEQELMRSLHVNTRENLFRALGAHIRWGKPKYSGPPLEKSPVQPVDAFPNKVACRNIWGSYSGLNTYSDELAPRPLASVSMADVKNYRWPDPKWFDYTKVGPPLAEPDDFVPLKQWTQQHADCAHLVGGYEPIFGRICDLCGIERTLFNLSLQPEVTQAIVERITDFLAAYYEQIAIAGKNHIDILAFGDDFASQNGMMFSPQQWREFFKPSWQRLFAIAHKYGMKAQFHSCGCIRPVLGDLIDAGMDIFEVVQLSATDMDAAELKREFGGDMTFFGAVDVQTVLPSYSEEEVRQEVRRLIDCLAKGGRFILANSHILMEDVPAINVITMFDEARGYKPASVK